MTLIIRLIDEADKKLLLAFLKVSGVKANFEALANEASTPLAHSSMRGLTVLSSSVPMKPPALPALSRST